MKLDFLKQFIKQTQTDSLKTKDYPKEFLDLKMKVSFGQGALARVPWVALRAPDMPVSNGYNPVYLFYKKQGILVLSYGISETHIPEKSWEPSIHETKTRIDEFIDKRTGDVVDLEEKIDKTTNRIQRKLNGLLGNIKGVVMEDVNKMVKEKLDGNNTPNPDLDDEVKKELKVLSASKNK